MNFFVRKAFKKLNTCDSYLQQLLYDVHEFIYDRCLVTKKAYRLLRKI